MRFDRLITWLKSLWPQPAISPPPDCGDREVVRDTFSDDELREEIARRAILSGKVTFANRQPNGTVVFESMDW